MLSSFLLKYSIFLRSSPISNLSLWFSNFYLSTSAPNLLHSNSSIEIISFYIFISVLLAFFPTIFSAYFFIFACSSSLRFSARTNSFCSSKLLSNLGRVFLFLSKSPAEDLVSFTYFLLLFFEPSRMIKFPILRLITFIITIQFKSQSNSQVISIQQMHGAV